MYFHGIERRFFLDRTKREERKLLVAEVNRLASNCRPYCSIKRYLRTFLDFARMMDSDNIEQIEYEGRGYELPLGLALCNWSVDQGRNVAGCVLDVSMVCFASRNSTAAAARHAPSEFKALFTQMFKEKYPNGLKVNAPKTRLKLNTGPPPVHLMLI